MTADITQYLGLITSEHNQRPKFMAVMSTLMQPCADIRDSLLGMSALFDLDAAVGDQQDKNGQWIGQSRNLDPTTATQAGVSSLTDYHYTPLLKGLAFLNNQWDGSTALAYSAYVAWFSVNYPGASAVIQDNGDLTILIGQAGAVLDQVDKALFNNGYLEARSAGVLTKHHVTATAAAPLFGLGAEGNGIAGLGVGCWGTFSPPS